MAKSQICVQTKRLPKPKLAPRLVGGVPGPSVSRLEHGLGSVDALDPRWQVVDGECKTHLKVG